MSEQEVFDARIAYCKKLSAIAREKKITQQQLAELTGLAQSSINRFFSGKIPPTLDTMIIVCNALGVEINFLILQ